MKSILKQIIQKAVDTLARIEHFSFPESFLWYWKLDYLLGRYEPETTAFFKKHIRSGMSVMDIGANLGYYTKLFSKLVGPTGTVYAFEPDEENWAYLVQNTKHLPNVKTYKSALADKDGVIDFYHVIGMTGTHSVLPAAGSEKRSVACTSVDAFLKVHGIQRIDALKIDVEGAEDSVFRGMSQVLSEKPSPYIVFEYTPETSMGLFKELQASHTIYSIGPHGVLQSSEEISFKKGKRLFTNVLLYDGEL